MRARKVVKIVPASAAGPMEGKQEADMSRKWMPLTNSGIALPANELAVAQASGIQSIWGNNRYWVFVRRHEGCGAFGTVIQLSIKTHDGNIRRDWREWMHIKDEICGPHWYAVEVYPPREYEIDNGNVFHLWAWDPQASGFSLPFGWKHRNVFKVVANDEPQRPFHPNEVPEDAKDASQYVERVVNTQW